MPCVKDHGHKTHGTLHRAGKTTDHHGEPLAFLEELVQYVCAGLIVSLKTVQYHEKILNFQEAKGFTDVGSLHESF